MANNVAITMSEEEKTTQEPSKAQEALGVQDAPDGQVGQDSQDEEAPHSIFTKRQRIIFVYIASLAAFASPVSSGIYYPAMLSLAEDLNTSMANIGLTITTYMIFQGVAPTIVGGISDQIGRRPACLLSFTIFVAANIGLALQTDFAALLVLRGLQSCGSSGTVALASAVVADVATTQQRGSYIGLAALGAAMGPALGPLIGGLLNHYLGWRSIFWFLAIFGGVMLLVYVVFIPETCRNIVGNGSIPPQRWNRPLIALLETSSSDSVPTSDDTAIQKRPGIMSSIPIMLDKETALILFFSSLLYAGFFILLTSLPQQLEQAYHYNSIQVGLCFLPLGIGPILVRPLIGRIMDANFRRHAQRLGIEIVENRQQDIDEFPIEKVRLEVALAFTYLSGAAFIPYGWVMSMRHPPLPAVLVLLFVLGVTSPASFQPLTALIIDINPQSPAAATAAHQFARCLLGAGGVAVAVPMLNMLKSGWTATLIALIWVVMSICWWAAIIWGPKWRKEKRQREILRRNTA